MQTPSPPTIVAATHNVGKQRELAAILKPRGVKVVFPADLGLGLDVNEDGETFAANAAKKARAFATAAGLPALADDSGLEVDALGGEPGVQSARWRPGTDQDRLQALLARLAAVPDARRTARFVAVVALAWPSGARPIILGEGRLEGRIARAPRGEGGFGYDPIFLVTEPPYDGRRTLAELPASEKNRLSHRARAIDHLWRELGS